MSSIRRPVNLALAIGSALSLSATQAAVITVDTLADPGSSEDCSLRSAIETLRTQSLVDGCYGDLDGIDDTIVFEDGLSGIIALTYGQLSIDAPMSIEGPGPNVVTIDAGGSSRIATIDSSDTVAISGLTLTGGGYDSFGGALYVNSDLALSDCVLTGNQATANGGAMEVFGGSATIDDCVISENQADQVGGGIAVTDGFALIRNSSVTGNQADRVGGGLWVAPQSGGQGPEQSRNGRGFGYYATELQVETTVISGNGATVGGGVGAGYYNAYGPEVDLMARLRDRLQNRSDAPQAHRGGPMLEPNLRISDSIISDNLATIGGGIGTYARSGPGYIGDARGYPIGGGNTLISEGNTITGNTALFGGGVGAKYGNSTLIETTVENNTAYYAGGGIANLSQSTFGPGPQGRLALEDLRGVIGGYGGQLFLDASTVSGNNVIGVSDRGYPSPYGYFGGGIFNAFGLAYIAYSQVSGNESPALGGGIANFSGGSVSYGSEISGNSGGGVINAYGGQFLSAVSRIEGNSNGPVGGLSCEDESLCSVKYSSVTGNSGGIAGGIGSDLGILGGGINAGWAAENAPGRGQLAYSQVEVFSSTVSANEGGSFGGVVAPDADIAHSTIAFNTSSQMPVSLPAPQGLGAGAGGVTTLSESSITHSIIAQNEASGANDLIAYGGDIAMTYSLVGDDQGFTSTGGGNIFNEDPLLGPLDLNGASNSLTHALLAGSPAIDAGDPAIMGEPDFDQRGPGFDRIVGGIIDIGAFEGTGEPPAEPGLGLSEGTIDFGSVRVGTQSSATLTLTSTGTGPVTLGSIGFGFSRGTLATFSIETDDCSGVSLPVGDSCDVSLGFAPDARDAFLADLVIPSDAPDAPAVVALSGLGVAPVLSIAPASINFGSVEVGASGVGQVTLSNAGDDDLSLSGVVISAPFSATSGSAGFCFDVAPTVLAPGASCSLQMNFAPLAEGSFAEVATVQSDSFGGDDSVSLSGTGLDGDQEPPPPGDSDAIPVPVMGHLATLLLGGGLMLMGWLGLRRRRI